MVEKEINEENSHWGKNPQFIQIFTFWKLKNHIFKVSFLTKFTISKSLFSQNSQFESLSFDKINTFTVSFFTKFTFF